MEIIDRIKDTIIKGDYEIIENLIREAFNLNYSAREILDLGLISGMNEVGRLFREHEIFLPDVLLSSKAMSLGINLLKPYFMKESIKYIGKVVIGTVRGDLHDIGKNLVSIMLRGAGFEVVDLGNDVSPERFVEVAVRENADLIGMSALLTTTMAVMKEVVDLLKERGLKGRIKTIIGGAPVTEEFRVQIDADGYAYDAFSGVLKAKELLGLK